MGSSVIGSVIVLITDGVIALMGRVCVTRDSMEGSAIYVSAVLWHYNFAVIYGALKQGPFAMVH